MIKYILIMLFVVLSIGCATETVYQKHPDQEKNRKEIASFNDPCAAGEYGEWAKNFLCYKLSR